MRRYQEGAFKELKSCIKRYQTIDNDLKLLNKQVYEKREARQVIELEMTDIIRLPEFSSIDKLKIEEDGSLIQIIKPGSQKPWGLSKKDLQVHLQDYFTKSSSPSFEECLNYIVTEQSKKLVCLEYNFNRVVK
jgi:hypothetical protein